MKNRILSIILCLGIICFNAYAAEQPEFAQQIASEEESFVLNPMEEVIVEEAAGFNRAERGNRR